MLVVPYVSSADARARVTVTLLELASPEAAYALFAGRIVGDSADDFSAWTRLDPRRAAPLPACLRRTTGDAAPGRTHAHGRRRIRGVGNVLRQARIFCRYGLNLHVAANGQRVERQPTAVTREIA